MLGLASCTCFCVEQRVPFLGVSSQDGGLEGRVQAADRAKELHLPPSAVQLHRQPGDRRHSPPWSSKWQAFSAPVDPLCKVSNHCLIPPCPGPDLQFSGPGSGPCLSLYPLSNSFPTRCELHLCFTAVSSKSLFPVGQACLLACEAD